MFEILLVIYVETVQLKEHKSERINLEMISNC